MKAYTRIQEMLVPDMTVLNLLLSGQWFGFETVLFLPLAINGIAENAQEEADLKEVSKQVAATLQQNWIKVW